MILSGVLCPLLFFYEVCEACTKSSPLNPVFPTAKLTFFSTTGIQNVIVALRTDEPYDLGISDISVYKFPSLK